MPTRTPVTFEELFRSRSDLFRAHCLANFQFSCEYIHSLRPNHLYNHVTEIPYKSTQITVFFGKSQKNDYLKLIAPRRQTSFISRGTTPGRLYGTRGMRTRSPVTFEELFASRSDRFRVHCLADFQFSCEYIHSLRPNRL